MKGLRVLMLATIVLVAVAACSNEPQGGSSSTSGSSSSSAASGAAATSAVAPPAAIAEAGAISFCTAPPYPPAIFQENGEVKGSEVDIGNAIAATMGVKADWVVIGFDGFIAAVQGGKCDGYLGASTDTPERAQQVHFTDYVTVGRNYLVPKGNPKGINSESNLCGLSISLLVGTTEKEAVDNESTKCKAAGKPGIDVQVFDQDTAAGLALVTGKVDAYVSDSPGLVYYVNKDPDKFQLALTESVNPAPWGIATKKDNTELNDALQKAVDTIYADGTMQQILAKWGLSTIALK
jgi:polar amino acid transport system substrate-binding protein